MKQPTRGEHSIHAFRKARRLAESLSHGGVAHERVGRRLGWRSLGSHDGMTAAEPSWPVAALRLAHRVGFGDRTRAHA